MFLLKFNLRFRRIVSLLMTTAVIQAGFLGGAAPLLAQQEETISGAVYENPLPPGVDESVYNDQGKKPDLPPPLNFRQEDLLDELTANEGEFSVSGQVTENSTGMPLTGVNVKLLLNGHPTQFKTSTDEKGSYNLTGIGSGEFQLTFQSPGYASEKFDIIFAEVNVIQDCGLFRNTSLKGRVIDQDGVALEGVEVSLTDENLPDRGVRLLTNVDGWFNLVDVPPGRYGLSVSQSVYHKQKKIWVDEYPQELTMVLPVSVADVVYKDILAADRHPGAGQENPDSPNGADVPSEQIDNGTTPGEQNNNESTPGEQTNDGGVPSEQPGVGDTPDEAAIDGQNGEVPGDQPTDQPNDSSSVGMAHLGGGTSGYLPSLGYNFVSFSSASQRESRRISLNWYPEFHALKAPSPLAELEQLLKQQSTMD